jgi:hypothetical protein
LEDLSSDERFEQSKEVLIPESIDLFSRICKNLRDGMSMLEIATISPVRSADPRQLLLPGIELQGAGLAEAPQSIKRRPQELWM